MRFIFHQLAGLAIAIMCTLLIATPVQAQPARLYRVTFHDFQDLARLAEDLDIWEVDHRGRTVLAPLLDAQAATLRLERRLTLDPDQSPLQIRFAAQDVRLQATGIPGFACYRTVEETAKSLSDLAAASPDLARLVNVGSSWERLRSETATGYDLQVLILTHQRTPGPKPVFFLMGALHARELTTAETALRFAEELLAGYGTDPEATWLLDHAELHVMPLANPDGRKRAEQGLLWRKNTNSSAGLCASPWESYGIDLNRNSSFQWNSCPGCSSGSPCSITYRGTHPASEPETQAIEEYVRSVITSRRTADSTTAASPDTPGLLISLHSYGELILYPWGWSTMPAPNRDGLHTLGLKFGYHTNYRVCQAGANDCLYQTDGTTDDWAYGELGIPAYTFELGTAFFQSCAAFEDDILPGTLDALRYAFLAAAQPYTLPAGPDAIEFTVTAGIDSFVQLDLRADAARYAGASDLPAAQPVVAARYALNSAPWNPAVPTWDLAVRASQADSSQAVFTASLDTTCLPTGRHTLVAQAMNQRGDWGVPSAAFVDVTGEQTILAELDRALTPAGIPVQHTLVITNNSSADATYTLTALPSPWAVSLPIPSVGPLAPGASAVVPVMVTPPNQAAGAIAPAGVEIRAVESPSACLHVYSSTQIDRWTLRMPFIYTGDTSR